ncbi:MAG: hypothetical protein GY943_27250, partial [Chloroflexi bacterium]|nr:hypothetical protein [Chloroflexota bacterium]
MNHHKQKQKVSDPTLAAWQSQVKQSYKKPWLSIIMREHQPILFSRFSHFYDQIRALPRWTRRRLKRKLGMTFAGAALMLALSRAAVQANSIAVVDGEVGINANGLCSLVEAIENANDTSSDLLHADCAAGDPAGADIINLPTNGSFTLTAVYGSTHYGANGLPDISSQITIEGNGSTIERDSGAPS